MKNRSAENTVAGNGSLLAFLSGAAEKIISLSLPRGAYIAAFAAFVLLSGIVSYFHEPWLDEAQSWLIARDASYHDMIFVLPHYEGHPCLWWLLLSIPAKLGAPYELSLGVVMLIISSLSAYLIMFRSPMHPLVRIMLPFTYFFFYQYGIIARPYGLMILSLLLAAHFFKDKDEKPFPYVLSLMLLCSASAYGIVLSGGLAAVWCFRILKEYGGFKGIFTKFIGTKRFVSLLLLLCFAAAVILSILSYEDTFSLSRTQFPLSVYLQGIWYMLFMLPADALLIYGNGLNGPFLKYYSYGLGQAAAMFLPSIAILGGMVISARRKGRLPELLVPYSLLVGFGATVYFAWHHIGIAAAFFVFIIWICSEEGSGAAADNRMTSAEKYLCTGVSVCCIAVGIIWSFMSSVCDIRRDYCYGRAAAEFIRENNLTGLNIMTSWSHEVYYDGTEAVTANLQPRAAVIAPYFKENIFFNDSGDPSKGYILHKHSESLNRELFDSWSSTVPDILVGEVYLSEVYSDVRKTDYILIKTLPYTQAFKMGGAEYYLCIYMRKDLLKDHPGIEPEDPDDREFIE